MGSVHHLNQATRIVHKKGAGTKIHWRVYKQRVGAVIQIDCDTELLAASVDGFERAVAKAEGALAAAVEMTGGVALAPTDGRMVGAMEHLKIAATAMFTPRRVLVEASKRMFYMTARNVPAVFATMKSIIDKTPADVIGQASGATAFAEAAPLIGAIAVRMIAVIKHIAEIQTAVASLGELTDRIVIPEANDEQYQEAADDE